MPSPTSRSPSGPSKPHRRAAVAPPEPLLPQVLPEDLPEGLPEGPQGEETLIIARPSARIHFDSPEDLVGHTLNSRYKILSLLGCGGMGNVYLAEHVLINKQVAIKVLSPAHSKKPDEVERFLREARAASRIRHENVVDITDFGYTSGGLAFLVMEYLEGEDLATTSIRDGALPWRRAARITRQMCSALEAAHKGGIIHRDMKPENVFRITRGADPDFIKVLDFGIAKIIDEHVEPSLPSSTNSGLLGTPEYVAPELIRGLQPDPRVDIYAVGVIFYRLLTGRLPFSGDSFMATLTQHLMEPPKPLRQVAPQMDIPEALEAVCLRALVKDPDRRYTTIVELLSAISAVEAALPEPGAAARAAAAADPPTPLKRRLVVIVAVLTMLMFAGVLALVLPSLSAPKKPPPAAATATASAAPPAPKKTAPTPDPTPDEPPPVPSLRTDEPLPSTSASTPTIPEPTKVRAPVPERLTSIELRSKMDRLQDKVKSECSRYAMKKMAVNLKLTVAASGKVDAVPTGSQGGGLAECVVKVAKAARYQRTVQGGAFEYTFRM